MKHWGAAAVLDIEEDIFVGLGDRRHPLFVRKSLFGPRLDRLSRLPGGGFLRDVPLAVLFVGSLDAIL